MKVISISKEEQNELEKEEVINIFKTSISLDEIKSAVKKAKDRIYLTWASVDGVDKDGERIPIDLIIKSQEQLMERDAPIMLRHTNKKVGKTLAFKTMQHPKTGKIGVLHLDLVHNSLPIDNEVWEGIKSNKYKGSSVGGMGITGEKEYSSESKSIVDVFTDFGQYETSLVVSPSNPNALNEAYSVVAKEEKIKMVEENINFDDIKKELQEVKKSISDLNDKLEVKKEESKPEEPSQEDTQKEDKFETLNKKMDEMMSTMKEYMKMIKREEPNKKDSKSDEEKETKKGETEEQPAEEQETEKEEGEIVKTDRPETKDVAKEATESFKDNYNKCMAKFQNGEMSYDEMINSIRGN